MKRSTAFIFTIMASLYANAAEVHWNQISGVQNDLVTVPSGGSSKGFIIEGAINEYPGAYSYFGIELAYDMKKSQLVGLQVGMPYNIALTAMSYWVLATVNDIVTEQYIHDSRLIYDGLGDLSENQFGEEIRIKNGESIYLAFIAPMMTDQSKFDYDSQLYGWVELKASNNALTIEPKFGS